MPADSLDDVTGLDNSRLYAALAYLGVLLVVPWLTHRGDPFVNWHLRQGFLLFVGMVLALIAAAWWPAVGGLLFLLLLVLDVVALVMALQGRRWKVPGLGALADKIRF